MSERRNESSPSSLERRIARGGLWILVLRISNRLLQFVALLVLARLLVPEDFGLMGVTLVTIAAFEIFSVSGLREALVQRKGDVESYIETAWTANLIRAATCCLILLLAAPAISSFFEDERITLLLRVMSISLMLKAFTNFRVLYFEKELDFKREFIYQVTGTVAQVAVSVSVAVATRSVWSLVAGYISGEFVRLIASYLLIRSRPRLRIDGTRFKEMLGFGKWILGSNALIFIITQGDDAFVGKVLGTAALGFYQLAYRISNLPVTEITHTVSRVTFPAYSKIQDDTARLREVYMRIIQVTTFAAFPIAGLILVLGGDFTRLFLGDKWMPMVPAMQVLVFFGITRTVGASLGPIFNATNRPNVLTMLAALQLAILIAIIFPLSAKWGIVGVSLAVLTANLVTQLIAAIKAMSILEAAPSRLVRLLTVNAACAALPLAALAFIRSRHGELSIPAFILAAASAGVTYLALSYAVDRTTSGGLWSTIRTNWR
jgi:O-antigen/teichoic acid export membrane protein